MKMKNSQSFYTVVLKRIFDIVLSLSGIIILSWLYIILFFLIGKKLGKPILFKQERTGKNGKIFTMYKFRTMRNSFDESGEFLSDDERMTTFGSKLRSLSLDELPELFNILKGDMSVIGPRPLLPKYLPRYSKEQYKRHDVKPGLTGLAQVNGRNAISWEKRFEFDVEYTEKVSFFYDLKIFFMTIKTVLVREGISSEGTSTMEEFMGDKNEHIIL
ncbi:sugar transferase [Erysipelothrix rhusiopathiae str. Fujisawa]|uniref:Sugar transferase n=2 Tax=Erysipelothrix rhusiopathiae TaxID=1648 RepID=A0A2Z6FZ53_ERYRH|nr:sugar transferase [Erysipelothrix rhusiopathiae]BAK32499.1 sugar transferase [Erysipelothrix rhusiopathiae str. Fujisawa]AOO67141.1 sugar transferase [Erysipelothrix rhusiopathiae]QDE03265.1 sugar transferase [Erysipelothrix rhusiopathiae]QDE04954.1 sugar transferase [Erysipelothrix rhusiopathiae]